MIPLLAEKNETTLKAITSTQFRAPSINHTSISLRPTREITHRCVGDHVDMGGVLKGLGMRKSRRSCHKQALRFQDSPDLTHRFDEVDQKIRFKQMMQSLQSLVKK